MIDAPRRILVHDYSGHPFQVQLSRSLAARGHVVLHLHSSKFQTPKGPLQRRADDPASLLIEGVELTLRELSNVFAKHGIAVITPRPGDKFDPSEHEAMFEAAVPGTIAGEIIQVMDNGFRLHDRLLRPAKVGVSSTPAS